MFLLIKTIKTKYFLIVWGKLTDGNLNNEIVPDFTLLGSVESNNNLVCFTKSTSSSSSKSN